MSIFDPIVNVVTGLFGGDNGIVPTVIKGLKDLGIVKDAEQELKAQQFLMDYQLRISDQAIERLKVGIEDTANARAREIALKDRTPKILAYAAFVGFFSVLSCLIFVTIPPGSQSVIDVMLGVLGFAVTGIINYYFGSSAGSAAKSQTIDKLMNNGTSTSTK